MRLYKLIYLLLLLACQVTLQAQQPNEETLFHQLAKQDSVLFDAAFNTCDLSVLESLFTPDFEFYHDKAGATYGSTTFLSEIKAQCAQRSGDRPQPSRRILVPNSLEVYPLYQNGNLYGMEPFSMGGTLLNF
ncbi:MAG: hypothetical protein AAGF77_08425 [Bacteroidota bacterium]